MLKHEPHGFYIVTCKSPVSLRLEVAQAQFFCKPVFDTGCSARDLAGNKLEPPPRRFVVE